MGIALSVVTALSPARMSLEEFRNSREFGICVKKGCPLEGREQSITVISRGEVPRCHYRFCRMPLWATSDMFMQPVPAPAKTSLPEKITAEAIAVILPEVFIRLRRDRHYSQRQLAKLMKVPRTYVSKIEHGGCVPTFESMERFALIIGISLYDLVRVLETFPLVKKLCQDDAFMKEVVVLVKSLSAEDRVRILAMLEQMKTSATLRLKFRAGALPA